MQQHLVCVVSLKHLWCSLKHLLHSLKHLLHSLNRVWCSLKCLWCSLDAIPCGPGHLWGRVGARNRPLRRQWCKRWCPFVDSRVKISVHCCMCCCVCNHMFEVLSMLWDCMLTLLCHAAAAAAAQDDGDVAVSLVTSYGGLGRSVGQFAAVTKGCREQALYSCILHALLSLHLTMRCILVGYGTGSYGWFMLLRLPDACCCAVSLQAVGWGAACEVV